MNTITTRSHSSLMDEDKDDNAGAATLISATKLHQASKRPGAQSLVIDAPESELDPIYSPLLQAAKALKEKIEAQHREKITQLTHDAAEQNQELQLKAVATQREIEHLKQQLQAKTADVERVTREKQEVIKDLQTVSENTARHIQEINTQRDLLENAEQSKTTAIQQVELQNAELIERLKAKIEQIKADYSQQLSNMEQDLGYKQQGLTAEVTALTTSNEQMFDELSQLRQERQVWQQGSSGFEEKIKQLETDSQRWQTSHKEKAEALLRNEHALKLANEELERRQEYIKTLEAKNNTLQKEVLENWIDKKE